MFDLNKARSAYDINGDYIINDNQDFSEYAPAYVVTNEDLRTVAQYMEIPGKDLLTAACSGDQPLFFSLYGPKNIDTFDISFCSKVMMDIKLGAVKKLDLDNYATLLQNIGKNNFSGLDFSYCQQDTKDFLQHMKHNDIFRYEIISRQDYFMPLPSEYAQMKKTVKPNCKFIWSDLTKLYTKLDKQYDRFYFSNIIQYNCDTDKIVNILNSLRPFMKKNAIIILNVAPFFIGDELYVFKKVKAAINDWAKLKLIKNKVQEICLVKKL